MSLKNRIGAEFVGTFWLVLGGCGSAILAAGFPGMGIGFLGVSLAFLGATDARAPQGFAPLAIGLGLTLIHLISIPVTNTSVNPARSTGPALIVGGWALAQLWLFWIAPLLGASIAGFVYRIVSGEVQMDQAERARVNVLVDEVFVALK